MTYNDWSVLRNLYLNNFRHLWVIFINDFCDKFQKCERVFTVSSYSGQNGLAVVVQAGGGDGLGLGRTVSSGLVRQTGQQSPGGMTGRTGQSIGGQMTSLHSS